MAFCFAHDIKPIDTYANIAAIKWKCYDGISIRDDMTQW